MLVSEAIGAREMDGDHGDLGKGPKLLRDGTKETRKSRRVLMGAGFGDLLKGKSSGRNWEGPAGLRARSGPNGLQTILGASFVMAKREIWARNAALGAG